ncbi:MAG: hypothetical protein LBS76_03530 [Mycoplasmataceae bacterium]|nr:hypothetical protein [Mycoplasmataceae bacterium]
MSNIFITVRIDRKLGDGAIFQEIENKKQEGWELVSKEIRKNIFGLIFNGGYWELVFKKKAGKKVWNETH